MPNLESPRVPSNRRKWIRRLVWIAGGVVMLLVLIALSSRLTSKSVLQTIDMQRATGLSAVAGYAGVSPRAILLTEPTVTRSAAIQIVSEDFLSAQARLRDLVPRHDGIVELTEATGGAGVERSLTTTLRFPASRFEAALAELRGIGRVEKETQSGGESGEQISAVITDLLLARAKRERYERLARDYPGTLADRLAVEQEIAKITEQIEELEAKRKQLESGVRFARIQVQLNQAEGSKAVFSARAVWRTLLEAAQDGMRVMVNVATALASSVLRIGPTLLLSGVVLFAPGRWAWKRLKPRSDQK